jgi:hypothetical protein
MNIILSADFAETPDIFFDNDGSILRGRGVCHVMGATRSRIKSFYCCIETR